MINQYATYVPLNLPAIAIVSLMRQVLSELLYTSSRWYVSFLPVFVTLNATDLDVFDITTATENGEEATCKNIDIKRCSI